ncbi:hydroxyacid dehydrogenase [Cellulosimicrobium cellulans]|uniref:2-hydroxyacid dehydrogenase n=1 Tax=Cellulosimicrobium cellulans TaxID=1710 RepID=UPI001962CBD5|nr:2-hydroxyacid dehydrogenase [Cellulosimicrobium cellulans]MBN0038584.1 hydroxyacid dehydrogenase [Cellulosimicrobium cellulans]
MSGLHVVVTDANLVPLRDELVARLPGGTEVSWAVGLAPDDTAAALRDAHVLVGPELTPAMAAAAPALRLVHVAGAGTDRVDPSALRPGVVVANTFHHERSIAEYVTWAAIDLRRDLHLADAALRTGLWRSSVYDRSLPQPQTLGAARVGLVGFGHIGSACWRALSAFGATGRAVTGRGGVDASSVGLEWAGGVDALPRLLDESDVVVVSVPLDERTRGMVGAPELARLGTDGVLVNVARGPVVDERALYEALAARTIRGAAVDVWYSYPGPDGQAAPAALPFHELDNVRMTPHLSGVTRQTFLGRVVDVAANVTALAEGRPLERVVALRPEEVPA